jgi:hypothetical protein
MGFGFTTARSAVADAHELTRALAESFDELVEKIPAHPSPRRRPRAGRPPARRTTSLHEVP